MLQVVHVLGRETLARNLKNFWKIVVNLEMWRRAWRRLQPLNDATFPDVASSVASSDATFLVDSGQPGMWRRTSTPLFPATSVTWGL